VNSEPACAYLDSYVRRTCPQYPQPYDDGVLLLRGPSIPPEGHDKHSLRCYIFWGKLQGMHVQAKKKDMKKRTSDSKHGFARYPNLVLDTEIVRPEGVWVCDIIYIRLHRASVYLVVVMNVFARGVREWHLGRGLEHSLTLTAFRRAPATHPAPEACHSVQWIQCAATGYTQVLHDAEVRISIADKDEAWQNGPAERGIRTIKEEEVDLSEYLDYHDAQQQVPCLLDDV